MQDKITLIITIKNRDTHRLENQVESIRNTGANPHIHLVDYGSDSAFAQEYQNICKKLNLQYTHMYAEGLPWNKCRAINYAAKTALCPFIVTSDADMIYKGNPFQWCLENQAPKTMYHIETYWLAKNAKISGAKYAGHGNSGGFQFIEKSAFAKIGGYDERMVYWGLEDLDWPERLKQIGYNQVWLPKNYKLYHQWHPASEQKYMRPLTASINTLKYSYENRLIPVKFESWGIAIEKNDRPILTAIETMKPETVSLDTNDLTKWETAECILNSKKNIFIKLNLAQRLKKRPFDFCRDLTKKALKPITALTGNSIQANINENFDVLYELLPLLQQNGLQDYYIAKDFSYIYLLWSN